MPIRDDMAEIRAGLRARMLDLVQMIDPSPTVSRAGEIKFRDRQGRHWITYAPSSSKAGWARCNDEPELRGKDSGPTQLVIHAMFGGDASAAFRFMRGWLGMEGGTQLTDAQRRTIAEERQRAIEARQVTEELSRREQIRQAKAYYLTLAPAAIDSPPLLYLAQARGLLLNGQPPGAGIGRGLVVPGKVESLRYDPAAWHPFEKRHFPAMVAPICRPDGRGILAMHITHLEERGGIWGKAPIELARLTIGPKGGGVIPLLRGPSRRRLAEAPDYDELVLAEGLEDTLTAGARYPERRAMATIDVGNVQLIELPASFHDIVFCADADGNNVGSMHALRRADERWLEQGRAVRFVYPPAPFKDFNAALCAALAGDGTPHNLEAIHGRPGEYRARVRVVA